MTYAKLLGLKKGMSDYDIIKILRNDEIKEGNKSIKIIKQKDVIGGDWDEPVNP